MLSTLKLATPDAKTKVEYDDGIKLFVSSLSFQQPELTIDSQSESVGKELDPNSLDSPRQTHLTPSFLRRVEPHPQRQTRLLLRRSFFHAPFRAGELSQSELFQIF